MAPTPNRTFLERTRTRKEYYAVVKDKKRIGPGYIRGWSSCKGVLEENPGSSYVPFNSADEAIKYLNSLENCLIVPQKAAVQCTTHPISQNNDDMLMNDTFQNLMEFLDITKYAESQDFTYNYQHTIPSSKAIPPATNIILKDNTAPYIHTSGLEKEQPIGKEQKGNEFITSSVKSEAAKANQDDNQPEEEPAQVNLKNDLLPGDEQSIFDHLEVVTSTQVPYELENSEAEDCQIDQPGVEALENTFNKLEYNDILEQKATGKTGIPVLLQMVHKMITLMTQL